MLVITNDKGQTLALTVETCHWRVSRLPTRVFSRRRSATSVHKSSTKSFFGERINSEIAKIIFSFWIVILILRNLPASRESRFQGWKLFSRAARAFLQCDISSRESREPFYSVIFLLASRESFFTVWYFFPRAAATFLQAEIGSRKLRRLFYREKIRN